MKKVLNYTALLILILVACSKDNDSDSKVIPEDLFGRWEFELPGGAAGAPDQLFVWIFDKKTDLLGSYEFQWNVTDQGGQYFLVGGERGECTTNGDMLFLETEWVGTQWDPDQNLVLDSVIWYDRNDPFWSMYERTEKVKFKLSVEGLEIVTDDNGDGKFDEQAVLFTKK